MTPQLDNGRWIMIMHKPPTKPSPSKFSLFWSLPAPSANVIQAQRERFQDSYSGKYVDWGGFEYDPDDLPDAFVDLFGLDSNAEKWRRIVFMGQDIVLQPHEFEFKSAASMRELLFAIPRDNDGVQVYELIENSESAKLALAIAEDTDLKSLYEAALLDGCTPPMAQMVALGQDISDEAWEFPAIGYYRPIVGTGLWESYADIGEPLASRDADDPYWMLKETPPYTERELLDMGKSTGAYEERQREAREQEAMGQQTDEVLGEDEWYS